LTKIIYANKIFVIVEYGGIILIIQLVLHGQYKHLQIIFLTNIAYISNGFIAVGESGTILTSSKGTSWFKQTSPTLNILYDIIYENGMYVAEGQSGNIFISPNNNGNWRRETTVWDDLAKIIYTNNILITVGVNGRVAICNFVAKISLA
jgi:hypothetical protein